MPLIVQLPLVLSTPLRKDISLDLNEATVAAYQSGKGYKAVSIRTILQ